MSFSQWGRYSAGGLSPRRGEGRDSRAPELVQRARPGTWPSRIGRESDSSWSRLSPSNLSGLTISPSLGTMGLKPSRISCRDRPGTPGTPLRQCPAAGPHTSAHTQWEPYSEIGGSDLVCAPQTRGEPPASAGTLLRHLTCTRHGDAHAARCFSCPSPPRRRWKPSCAPAGCGGQTES